MQVKNGTQMPQIGQIFTDLIRVYQSYQCYPCAIGIKHLKFKINN